MSFYSALVLAANEKAREPSPHDIWGMFLELGLVDPATTDREFGNLASDITELFADESALNANSHFFCPDSISFESEIEILGPDGDFVGRDIVSASMEMVISFRGTRQSCGIESSALPSY